MLRLLELARRGMMRKNFSLIELVIAIIIFSILATFAIPIYNGLLERAKAEVCEGNLSTLLGALENYGLEEDQMPGSLSQLKKEHLEKGWAKTFKERGLWRTKLAYFLVDFDKKGLAYAQAGLAERYLGGVNLACPSYEPQGGDTCYHGYGLEASIDENMSYSAYKALDSDFIVIADSNSATFGSGNATFPEDRHEKHRILAAAENYALGVSKGKAGGCIGSCPAGFRIDSQSCSNWKLGSLGMGCGN